MAAVTIPVMAKIRIGHFVEAQILQSIGVDCIDESEGEWTPESVFFLTITPSPPPPSLSPQPTLYFHSLQSLWSSSPLTLTHYLLLLLLPHLPPPTPTPSPSPSPSVLTPADDENHVDKHGFKVPFVCGARNLGEALRRISEGAAMIRTKGEAGTGRTALHRSTSCVGGGGREGLCWRDFLLVNMPFLA